MSNKVVWIASLLLLLLAGGAAFADRVVLKSGDLIEGMIAEETDTNISVQVDGGYIGFSRDEVLRVVRQSEEDNKELVVRWAERRRMMKTNVKKRKKSLLGFLYDMEGMFDTDPGARIKVFHRHFHSALMNFPPTAFVLNLGPITQYRQHEPALYVLAFYSILLLLLALIAQKIQGYVRDTVQKQKQQQSRKNIRL